MKRNYLFIFLTLLVSLPSLCVPPDGYLEKIAVLNAPDAPGVISRERIATVVSLIAHDLKMELRDVPNIVVMHVTARDAATAGIRDNPVRRNTGPTTDPRGYYEFWIVGEPRAAEYSAAIYNILENRAGHRLEQPERIAIMRRALRYLEATVSVSGE